MEAVTYEILQERGSLEQTAIEGVYQLWEYDGNEYVVLADNTVITRAEDNSDEYPIFPYTHIDEVVKNGKRIGADRNGEKITEYFKIGKSMAAVPHGAGQKPFFVDEAELESVSFERPNLPYNSFAEACYNDLSEKSLWECYYGGADETDMESWGITKQEWRESIISALLARINDDC